MSSALWTDYMSKSLLWTQSKYIKKHWVVSTWKSWLMIYEEISSHNMCRLTQQQQWCEKVMQNTRNLILWFIKSFTDHTENTIIYSSEYSTTTKSDWLHSVNHS